MTRVLEDRVHVYIPLGMRRGHFSRLSTEDEAQQLRARVDDGDGGVDAEGDEDGEQSEDHEMLYSTERSSSSESDDGSSSEDSTPEGEGSGDGDGSGIMKDSQL